MTEEQIILKATIINYQHKTNAKIYGDNCIGYRAQLPDGSYDDEVFGKIYEDMGGIDACDDFNDACYELRSGENNW